MKKIEIVLYNFNELSEDVQKKLIEEEIGEIINNNFEYLHNDFEIMMEEDGIDDLKISYSLSYSQGDGVSFEGVIDFTKNNIFKNVLDNSEYKQAFINMVEEGCVFRLVRKNHHYSHKYTCDVEDDVSCGNEESRNIVNEFDEQLKKAYLKLCDEYEEVGYNCYEVSEEDAINSILEKDLLYFEDGRIYKY